MNKSKEYKVQGTYKGINDLKSIYAFHGNSQGDTSVSNDIDVYKSSNGWMCISKYFKDIDCSNQEEINKRSLKLKKENDKYIAQCHKNNTYGEYNGDITFKIMANPLMDNNIKIKKSSLVFDILDFSKITK